MGRDPEIHHQELIAALRRIEALLKRIAPPQWIIPCHSCGKIPCDHSMTGCGPNT